MPSYRTLTFCFLCMGYSLLFGQNFRDSSGIEYIYVEKSARPVVKTQAPVNRNKGDFFRNMQMIRVNLYEPANLPLLQASKKAPNGNGTEGIVMAIISQMKKGKLTGRHPTDLRHRYDFFDLVYDLIALEGISLESQQDSIRADELGFEWLNTTLDLIVDRGFSTTHSRHFQRIKFLRLIWHNPNSARGAHVLIVFPYQELVDLFGSLYCATCPGINANMSVGKYLEMNLFRGQALPIAQDPSLYMPRRKRTGKNQTDFWKK